MTDVRWIDAEAVAEYLGYYDRDGNPNARQIRERIALLPDFPKPMRVGTRGHPRWRSDEVARWAEQQRTAA
jgi:hypothetical protein